MFYPVSSITYYTKLKDLKDALAYMDLKKKKKYLKMEK